MIVNQLHLLFGIYALVAVSRGIRLNLCRIVAFKLFRMKPNHILVADFIVLVIALRPNIIFYMCDCDSNMPRLRGIRNILGFYCSHHFVKRFTVHVFSVDKHLAKDNVTYYEYVFILFSFKLSESLTFVLFFFSSKQSSLIRIYPE